MTAITTPGDHELLEMAAKAAGIKSDDQGQFIKKDMNTLYDGPQTVRISWNPLTDDGDALRLAVKLAIDFYEGEDVGPATYAGYFVGASQKFAIVQHSDDPYAATRRAILLAAAAIGAAL